MKKTILSILSVLTISASLTAQIEIMEQGTTTDIAGASVTSNISSETSLALGNDHLVDLDVINNTGSSKSILITRINISNPSGWKENICWGDPLSGGVCYPHSTNDPWTSNAINIADGGSVVMALYITAPTGGSAHYRYYITEGSTFLDSVDWIINSTLSIEEQSPLTLNVAPNPANNVMNIEINTSADVKMVDVLGNVVLTEKMEAGKKAIDVSSFKNGVYFVMIEAEGIKPTTRKVIIRH